MTVLAVERIGVYRGLGNSRVRRCLHGDGSPGLN